MSLADKRQDLAAAIGGVTGLTGYPYPPNAWKAGDAWPTWGGGETGDSAYAHSHVHTWRVLVVLAVDQQQADAMIDSLIEEIVDALVPHLAITGYQPVRLTPEGSGAAFHAVAFIGESE